MSVRKGNKNFHTIYDDKTLENMKRYYGIDTDDELVKYIKEIALWNLMKVTLCIFKRSIRNHKDSSSRIKTQVITYVRNIFVKPPFDE